MGVTVKKIFHISSGRDWLCGKNLIVPGRRQRKQISTKTVKYSDAENYDIKYCCKECKKKYFDLRDPFRNKLDTSTRQPYDENSTSIR